MPKLTELKRAQYIKVLLFGESGTGKTCGASTFPGPIFYADFDNKVESVASFIRDDEKLSEITYEKYPPVDQKGTSYEKWDKKLDGIKRAFIAGERPFETIVLDSLTTLSDELMKYLMRTNPGIKRTMTKGVQIPALQDYGINRLYFKHMLMEFLAMPCNLVVTAHIDITKDETTGQILRHPMMAGKLANELNIFFPEVYRTFVKDGKYMAQTQADRQYNCRSQLNKLPKEIEFSYDLLKKHF